MQFSRAFSVLSLEVEAKTIEKPFLDKGLELVVDGSDTKYIKKILRYLILADKLTNAETLERLIITEETLALQ